MNLDSTKPWGSHALPGLVRAWLRLCQRVAHWSGFGRLAFGMRRPLKQHGSLLDSVAYRRACPDKMNEIFGLSRQ